MRSRRVVDGIAAILLALHAALLWLARPPGILNYGDDAVYVILARSLREGSYRELYRVGEPVHHFYPPGWPAVLAFWGGITGERFDALILLNVAAAVLALGLVFLAVRRRFGPAPALLSLAALTVNPDWVLWATSLMSEIPYAALTLLALWLLARERRPSPETVAAAGTVAIAAALTRSVGATLLIAMGAYLLLQRRWRATAIFGVACAATVGVWLVLGMGVTPEVTTSRSAAAVGISYSTEAAVGIDSPRSLPVVLALRVVVNAYRYAAGMLPAMLALPDVVPEWALDNWVRVLVMGVGLVAGAWALLRRWRAAGLYLLAYAALLAVWPWPVDRFVVPVLPLLVPALLLGLAAVARPLGRSWQLLIPATVAVAMVATGARDTLELVRNRVGCELRPGVQTSCIGENVAGLFAGFAYVGAHLPRNAVLLTIKRATLYYYTGRQTVGIPEALGQDSATFLPHLRAVGANYILLANVDFRERGRLLELLQADCRQLELQARFSPSAYLFRIPPADSLPRDTAACRATAAFRAATNAG